MSAIAAWLLAGMTIGAEPPVRLGIISSVIARGVNDPGTTAVAIHEACARVAGFSPRLAAMSRSEMLQDHLDDELRDCGADARCVAARLDRAGIDVGALLVVNLTAQPPLIALRLIDTARSVVLAERATLVRAGPESLLAVVGAEFAELLQSGGYPMSGRVALEVVPAEVKVRVEGEEVAGSVFVVSPGQRQISISADDYVETSTSVRVTALQESRVVLRLEPEPPIYASPWFWAGAVAVIAGAVVGGWVLFDGDDRVRICQTFDGVSSCPEN